MFSWNLLVSEKIKFCFVINYGDCAASRFNLGNRCGNAFIFLILKLIKYVFTIDFSQIALDRLLCRLGSCSAEFSGIQRIVHSTSHVSCRINCPCFVNIDFIVVDRLVVHHCFDHKHIEFFCLRINIHAYIVFTVGVSFSDCLQQCGLDLFHNYFSIDAVFASQKGQRFKKTVVHFLFIPPFIYK